MEEIFHLSAYENSFNEKNLDKILDLLTEFYTQDKNVKFYPKQQDNTKQEEVSKEFLLTFLKNSYNFSPNINQKEVSISVLDWKFEYGACILRILDEFDTSVTNLELLCLDSWELNFHPNQRSEYVSFPKEKPKKLHIGKIETYQEDSLIQIVDSIVQKAKNRTGDSRSAKNSNGGHQKTPGWIYGVYQCAISQLDFYIKQLEIEIPKSKTEIKENITPKSGFSDVGLHTGTKQRSTVYPLIKCTLYHVLGYFHRECEKIENVNNVYNYNILLFEVFLLERNEKFKEKNEYMQMIMSIARKANSLVDYDEKLIRDVYNRVEKCYKLFLSKNHQYKDANIQMESLENLIKLESPSIDLKYEESKYYSHNIGFSNLSKNPKDEEIQKKAEKNLDVFPFLKLDGKLKDLQERFKSNNIPLEFRISYFENFIFNSMKLINKDEEPIFQESEIKILMNLLERYELWTEELLKKQGLMKVQVKSNLILIRWGLYCFTHSLLKRKETIIEKYSIPLDEKDLDILCLSDKLALEAFIPVSNYVKFYHNLSGPKLFSGRETECYETFTFIREYFSEDTKLNEMSMEYQDYSKNMNEQRFEKIQNQIKDLESMNQELGDKEKQLESLEQEQLDNYRGWRKTKIYDLTKSIQALKKKIKYTEYFNVTNIHALPDDTDNLSICLFFLYMPDLISILANTGYLCYYDFSEKSDIHSQHPDFESTLTEHYTTKIPNGFSNPTESNFDTFMRRAPTNIGDRYIYKIKDPLNGVWYPRISLEFYWKRNNKYFNPFIFNKKKSIELFTEQIYKEELQNMMIMPNFNDIERSRDNIWVANQNLKPKEWTKSEFASFCQLRAYPLQQILKLLGDLKERRVKLSDENFHIMIRQILYQLGPLSNDPKDSLISNWEWKQDLLSGDVLKLFENVLNRYAEEIIESPQNYQTLLILSEISGYLSQFDKSILLIRRKFGKIAEKWADNLNDQIIKFENEGNYEMKEIFIFKQNLFLGYSILSLSMGELDTEDIQNFCSLIVRFNRTKPLIYDNKSMNGRVLNQVNYYISKRYQEILPRVKSLPLTLASKHILTNLEDEKMNWNVNNTYNFFTTKTKDDSFIHINLANGLLLYNGNPPNYLPNEIINHPLYKDVFGERNFTVVTEKNQTLKTSYPILERDYTFRYYNNTLLVHELLKKDKEKSPMNYKLLNHHTIQSWGGKLPKMLKELYAFWSAKLNDQQIIMLRPKSFKDHHINYLIVDSSVYKIPKEYSLKSVGFLLQNLDQLDRLLIFNELSDNLLAIISKFEKKKYIHIFKTPNNKFKIEIPRYDLQFEYNGSNIISLNYYGYQLRFNQELTGTFDHFHQYLILDLIVPDSVENIGNEKTKILVPRGVFNEKKKNIEIPSGVHQRLRISVFNVHPRFNTLKADTIEERLQLAAIHLATSSLLFESRIGMTGSEMAAELLRQCWKNSPFTDEEMIMLKNVSSFHKIQSSTSLLCYILYLYSNQLSFLYNKKDGNDIDNNYDASNEYRIEHSLFPKNIRTRLTKEEEKKYYGEFLCENNPNFKKLNYKYDPQNIDGFSKSLKSVEAVIRKLLVMDKTQEEEFPFLNDNPILQRSIGKNMIQELKESWKTSKSIENLKIYDFNIVKECVLKADVYVKEKRGELEKYIINLLEVQSIGLKFLKLANDLPRVTIQDLLRFSFNPDLMREFNPELSDTIIDYIKDLIMIWMQFCVLEDKLERMKSYAKESNDRITQEMMIERKWDPKEYPLWLVFEVEGGIQIRNEQYELIQQVMSDQPDTIAQLNMGLGKTRVVVPCLCLAWSNQEFSKTPSSNLVRIFFLSQIFEEHFNFLHLNLCASILNKKLYKFPFHRDIQLDLKRVSKIKESLISCQYNGGILIVSPEQIGSLILKREEIYYRKDSNLKILNELEKILSLPYYDIFDESDEILHYRKQLIYSIGSQKQLVSGRFRWETVQDILFILRHDQKIQEIIKKVSTKKVNIKYYEYDQLNLLPSKELESLVKDVSKALIQKLFNEPPESFEWMKRLDETLKSKIEGFILDLSKHGNSFIEKNEFFKFDPKYYQQILVLRGILGKEILYHCLEKRSNVDYGLLKEEIKSKNIAIPYLGADTPSDRSEFSHPDCSIIYTITSWYNHGLNRQQLKSVITHLLKCGKSTQEYVYNSWFELIRESEPELKLIDSIKKIDLSNELQLNILQKYYFKNMKTINYFMNNFIFPQETMVFEERLISSPWDLLSSKNKCGFSGTNDTSLLLPLTVKQREPNSKVLKASSGKILSLVLKKSIYKKLKSKNIPDLIDFIIEQEIDTLIDVGALLAGVDNRQFTDFLLERIPKKFEGVVYFDILDSDWKFKNRDGFIWKLVNSPVKEQKAFVFFDQRRCRGSDMKLKKNAKGLVTISPKLKKDDFIQACGRMRGLEYGQELVLSGDENVSKLILETVNKKDEKIEVKYVLEFVLINVVKTIRDGFLIFASNGRHYFEKKQDLKNSIRKEISTLEELYLDSNEEKSIYDLVEKDINVPFDQNYQEWIQKIYSHLKEFGSDEKIVRGTQDEECEREKERETEKEKEIDILLERYNPILESDLSLKNNIVLTKIERIAKDFSFLKWDKNIEMTKNFLLCVESSQNSHLTYNNQDEYLKFINFIIFDPKLEKMVLITDREAEFMIMELKKNLQNDDLLLIHYSLLKDYLEKKKFEILAWNKIKQVKIPINMIIQLKLFSGETIFKSKDEKIEIKKMFISKESIENVKKIITHRGNSFLFDKSDLEKLCVEFNEEKMMKLK